MYYMSQYVLVVVEVVVVEVVVVEVVVVLLFLHARLHH